MSWYKGKVCIVTGAASGIGLGISKHFLKHGAKVMLADVNAEDGDRIAKELGECAAFCKTDISSWASQCHLFAETCKRFGDRIDYVIANAGISQMRDFRSSDPAHFATSTTSVEALFDNPPDLRVIQVNTTGTLYTVHLALAYFRRQESGPSGWRGKLVVTGSNASFYPFPNDALYATSKAGILGLVRSVGPKVFQEGITVNSFGPCVLRTALGPPDFFDRLQEEGRITPIETIERCMDIFLEPASRLTGQMAECNVDKVVLRAVPEHLDGVVKINMNEFHPVDETADALQTFDQEVF